MAVKSTADILAAIKERLGESTEDADITLIEDISDTLTGLETDAHEDWKKKYEDNDKAWRKKYVDRFFTGTDEGEPEPEDPRAPRKYNYDDLFKEVN